MSAISPARKAAFQILIDVERGQSHSDDLLRGKAVNALSAPDRNLATALVLGVLRWQIRLDHQIQALLKRPNAKLDPEVRIALRLGAFQLLHMDRIPARAAIDESVELAKQAGHRFASGMVNAVLRKLATTHIQRSLGGDCRGTGARPGPSGLDGRALGRLLRPGSRPRHLPPRPEPACAHPAPCQLLPSKPNSPPPASCSNPANCSPPRAPSSPAT